MSEDRSNISNKKELEMIIPQKNDIKDTETKIKELMDAREDSILFRPKTETYETNQGDNVGDAIKKENHSHSIEEKKRDDLNRVNLEKSRNKTDHTY